MESTNDVNRAAPKRELDATSESQNLNHESVDTKVIRQVIFKGESVEEEQTTDNTSMLDSYIKQEPNIKDEVFVDTEFNSADHTNTMALVEANADQNAVMGYRPRPVSINRSLLGLANKIKGSATFKLFAIRMAHAVCIEDEETRLKYAFAAHVDAQPRHVKDQIRTTYGDLPGFPEVPQEASVLCNDETLFPKANIRNQFETPD